MNIIYGNGTTLFDALTDVTISLQAVDTFGNNITSGGEWFMITIQNECERNTTSFECFDVADQRQVLEHDFVGQMEDNSDGTYHYTFSAILNGTVTYYIYWYDGTTNGLRAEYFPSTMIDYNGDPDLVENMARLDLGRTVVYGTYEDNVSMRFYSLLKVPVTQDYDFNIIHDDASTIWFNNETLVDRYGENCYCDDYETMNLDASVLYLVKIKWIEFLGGATMNLKWDYPTDGTYDFVDTTYFYYPEYVLDAPSSVTVECPDGYTAVDPGSPQRCSNECSNSTGADADRCADGNLDPGDGCDSECFIEDDWRCNRFANAYDECFICTDGYELNDDETGCDLIPVEEDPEETPIDDEEPEVIETEEETPSEVSTTASSTTAAIGASLAVNAAMSLCNMASPQSIFGMVNQMQIVMLLPPLGVYLPPSIKDFFQGVNFSLLSFSFIPGMSNMEDSEYEETNESLTVIGIDSKLAILNLVGVFSMLGLMLLVHSTLVLCIYKAKLKTKKKNDCRRRYKKFRKGCIKFFTFGVYIHLYLETLLVCALTSGLELSKFYLHSDQSRIVAMSFICTLGVIVLITVMIIVNIWQWVKSKTRFNFLKLRYFKEFVNGYKDKWSCRGYTLIYQIKRLLMIAVTCTFFNEIGDDIYKVSLFLAPHIIDTILVIFLRPFSFVKDNLSEVINSCCFTALVIFFYFCRADSDWNSMLLWAFLGIIIADNIIYSLISMIYAVSMFIKKCIKLKNDKLKKFQVQDKPHNNKFEEEVREERRDKDASFVANSDITLANRGSTKMIEEDKFEAKRSMNKSFITDRSNFARNMSNYDDHFDSIHAQNKTLRNQRMSRKKNTRTKRKVTYGESFKVQKDEALAKQNYIRSSRPPALVDNDLPFGFFDN